MGISAARSTPFPGRFRYIFPFKIQNSKFKNAGSIRHNFYIFILTTRWRHSQSAARSMVTKKQPAPSFNAAEKIENFLNIGDSCYFVAQYLEDELLTALDPTIAPGENLSKTKRTSLCANLKIIIKAMTVAHDLSYASSSRISQVHQEKKAHEKGQREAKRQRKENERRNWAKGKKKRHVSINLLEDFYSKADVYPSSDSSGEESDVLLVASAPGPTTRSEATWADRLPPLRTGFLQYSPKEAIDFVMREVDKIDQARQSREKGLRAMIQELKEIKLYLVDKNKIPCSVKNLDRVVREFKKKKIYPA
jgi:hypothetical protein